MITPKPEVVAPVVAFEPANKFYREHLGVWEEEDFSGSGYPFEPYTVIGYDGQAWRIHEFWGPPIPPKTFFEKLATWIVGGDPQPSLVGREVTPVRYSLEEFKSEVCRRVPAYPNAVFDDELLVGEGLSRDTDLERLTTALIDRVSTTVQAASSIAGVMDALLEAQRDGRQWAEGFARA